MDLAYDHIADQTYHTDRAATPTPPKSTSTTNTTSSDEPPDAPTPKAPPRQNLQSEFQETFKAFSASPWGAKLGGWWSSTTKQGQSYYEEAVKEAEDLRVDALKGFNDLKETLVQRGRGTSGGAQELPRPEVGEGEDGNMEGSKEGVLEGEKGGESEEQKTDGLIERFQKEAAKRVKDLQAAEDKADEALLRFGTNIRNFLRDAVVITPAGGEEQDGEVLFESKDQSGKRVVHASRLDGQLYAIHNNEDSFTSDPVDEGGEWTRWKEGFEIEKETERVAADLERYTELRKMMERLAEKVEYKDFWRRYYYLRMVLEKQEERRKELLKGILLSFHIGSVTDALTASANDTEEVGWDEDSDDEKPSTPHIKEPQQLVPQNTSGSTTTINQSSAGGLKVEGRRSHDEKSVADSEASYDIVSGAPSRAASSPKERTVEESDEEDWE